MESHSRTRRRSSRYKIAPAHEITEKNLRHHVLEQERQDKEGECRDGARSKSPPPHHHRSTANRKSGHVPRGATVRQREEALSKYLEDQSEQAHHYRKNVWSEKHDKFLQDAVHATEVAHNLRERMDRLLTMASEMKDNYSRSAEELKTRSQRMVQQGHENVEALLASTGVGEVPMSMMDTNNAEGNDGEFTMEHWSSQFRPLQRAGGSGSASPHNGEVHSSDGATVSPGHFDAVDPHQQPNSFPSPVPSHRHHGDTSLHSAREDTPASNYDRYPFFVHAWDTFHRRHWTRPFSHDHLKPNEHESPPTTEQNPPTHTPLRGDSSNSSNNRTPLTDKEKMIGMYLPAEVGRETGFGAQHFNFHRLPRLDQSGPHNSFGSSPFSTTSQHSSPAPNHGEVGRHNLSSVSIIDARPNRSTDTRADTDRDARNTTAAAPKTAAISTSPPTHTCTSAKPTVPKSPRLRELEDALDTPSSPNCKICNEPYVPHSRSPLAPSGAGTSVGESSPHSLTWGNQSLVKLQRQALRSVTPHSGVDRAYDSPAAAVVEQTQQLDVSGGDSGETKKKKRFTFSEIKFSKGAQTDGVDPFTRSVDLASVNQLLNSHLNLVVSTSSTISRALSRQEGEEHTDKTYEGASTEALASSPKAKSSPRHRDVVHYEEYAYKPATPASEDFPTQTSLIFSHLQHMATSPARGEDGEDRVVPVGTFSQVDPFPANEPASTEGVRTIATQTAPSTNVIEMYNRATEEMFGPPPPLTGRSARRRKSRGSDGERIRTDDNGVDGVHVSSERSMSRSPSPVVKPQPTRQQLKFRMKAI